MYLSADILVFSLYYSIGCMHMHSILTTYQVEIAELFSSFFLSCSVVPFVVFVLTLPEQADIHMPLTTVREAIQFSAYMRLAAEITDNQRDAFIEEVCILAKKAL